MQHTQPSPTSHRVAWPGVVLRFEHQGDRWGHAVSLVSPGDGPPNAREDVVWLTSFEGAPEEAEPPSPAFQDLRWETLEANVDDATQEIAIGEFQLFGQCGRQVYSAAVRCSAGQIDFDLCVRVRGGEPFQPLCTYDSPGALTVGTACHAIGDTLQLEVLTLPNEPLATCRAEAGNRIIIGTGPVTLPRRKSQTLRWAYRICWKT